MSRPRHATRAAALAAALAALAVAAPGLAAGQAPGERPTTPAVARNDLREQTADQQVRHALHRLAFGPRPGDVERVRALGVDRWIELQLYPERLADTAGEAVTARHALLALSTRELFARVPPPRLLRAVQRREADDGTTVDSAALVRELAMARRASQQLLGELTAMRLARAVVSERQLEEVLVDFWSNHFNVFADKGPYARHHLVAYDRDVIRAHALGRFRDLLGEVAASPAMLLYLDHAQSRAEVDAPGSTAPTRARGLNENYARELLELHTLGVDGGYTQQDVVEVARAFTGWTIAPPQLGGDGGFVFRRARHDAGTKTVLGVALPAGRGIEDGEQVLDIVARHPATARFIAGKLARRFVSDDPPAALVDRAAATFTRTDGDLRAVVREIVTSPEFFSAAAYRAKVKSPVELVVSALRAVGAVPDATPRTARLVAQLGQPLFGHQAPDGWPETGDAWINTGAILGRINFGLALAAGRVAGADPLGWPGASELAGAPRERQVDGVIDALLGGAASPDTRAVLQSGTNPLLATRDAPPATAGSALTLMVGLAIGSPEFQRR